MTLTIQTKQERTFSKVLALGGSLDNQTAGELDAHLEEELKTQVRILIFDVGELTYIASSGLRSLVKAQKAVHARGGKSVVVNAQPAVKKVFDIVKAVDVDAVFKDVDELDRYLDQMQRQVTEGE